MLSSNEHCTPAGRPFCAPLSRFFHRRLHIFDTLLRTLLLLLGHWFWTSQWRSSSLGVFRKFLLASLYPMAADRIAPFSPIITIDKHCNCSNLIAYCIPNPCDAHCNHLLPIVVGLFSPRGKRAISIYLCAPLLYACLSSVQKRMSLVSKFQYLLSLRCGSMTRSSNCSGCAM